MLSVPHGLPHLGPASISCFRRRVSRSGGALAKHIRGPVSFSDVDELGDEYRVSPLVIEHQIDNQRWGFLTDS